MYEDVLCDFSEYSSCVDSEYVCMVRRYVLGVSSTLR